MIRRVAPILILLGVSTLSMAVPPDTKWVFEAPSNLYAPPLVADVHLSPGRETILCDSEARRLRCIDARGSQLWELDGGWRKRLISSPALTMSSGGPRLAIANGDGSLLCVDAASGAELWRKEVGATEWGGTLWADLTGDGTDEVIVGTEREGVAAFDGDGNELWRFVGIEGHDAIEIPCPLAAADMDKDGKAEIYAVAASGPLCIGPDGVLRWFQPTGDLFKSAMALADVDGDGALDAFCQSAEDSATWRFDAATGSVVWRTVMMGATDVYPGSAIAIGDIDQDGLAEIVAGDAKGNLYCIAADGRIRWVFSADKPAHIAASLGDVDGDGAIDVIAACGDHDLYGLSFEGRLQWRYSADKRLIYSPTIDDVDGDGRTDILFCGSDHKLRCITLGGAYRADLAPWPSRRFDARQSGTSTVSPASPNTAIREMRPVLDNGGFEFAKPVTDPKTSGRRAAEPRGWVADSAPPGTFLMDQDAPLEGSFRLKTQAGEKDLAVACVPIALEKGLRAVDASVQSLVGGTASLRWMGLNGVIEESPLAAGPSNGDWQLHRAAGVPVPRGSRWLQLVLTTPRGATAYWDQAEVIAVCAAAPRAQAFTNQVGYDVGAPKRFTVQSNFIAETAEFDILAEDGRVVHHDVLAHAGRIRGCFGHDWGFEHWRGDFTAFDLPGKYRIRVTLDGTEDLSWPFEIGKDLLWNLTARPAHRFFYYQRCGMAIPGFHEACHLDDARSQDGERQYDLSGGWHDAGDYNKYHNAPYVFGLAQAYSVRKAAFDRDDADANGIGDFLDEILWGGDHARRMIASDGSAFGGITSGYGYWGPPELETDNVPGTGDERPFDGPEDTGRDPAMHLAATARIARFVDDKAPWVAAAKRALDWAIEHGQKGPLQFSGALDLYIATGESRFAELAQSLFPGPAIEVLEQIEEYDRLFGEDHRSAISDALSKRADEILQRADNPFGIYPVGGTVETPNFFGTPADSGGWHVGTSSHVLNAAATVAKAHGYNPDPRYLAFVYDQINWELGNNPFNISLMEGCGGAFLPTYHHRYAFSGVPRGAVPGSVVNGVTWRDVGDDRPFLDLSGVDIPAFEPNEVWLPHNTAYLNALASLYNAQSPRN